MLIPPDSSKAQSDRAKSETIRGSDDNEPPSYYASTSESVAPSTPPSESSITSSVPSPVPPKPEIPPDPEIPAVNHLVIERTNNSIRGTWRVDTTKAIPQNMLPPLDGKETVRPNLKLKSTNGAINAKVELVADEKQSRAVIKAQTTNGSVEIQLTSPRGQKCYIELSSTNGAVWAYIPRSFVGPITTKNSSGSVKFAPAMTPNVVTFSETSGEGSHFIGDYEACGYGKGDWQGDELHLKTTHGSIKIFYVGEGEAEPSGKGKGKGFWSGLFGL